MKNRTIYGIGFAELVCALLGGYYSWVTTRVATMVPGAGGNYNGQAWFWFLMGCLGLVLLFGSAVLFFSFGEHRNQCGTSE